MLFFGGILKLLPLPKKNNEGQLRIIQGGHLKIRGAGKDSNMREHTKFLGGVEKIEGARLSGGLLQRGVKKPDKLGLCFLS